MMSPYTADLMRHISRCENNKLKTYSTIKEAFALEPYLTQSPLSIRRDITKLRISCHPLAIETGRYSKPYSKPPMWTVQYELCRRQVPRATGVSVLQQWESIDVWWNQPAYSAEQRTLSIHFQENSFIGCCKFCFHTSYWVIR